MIQFHFNHAFLHIFQWFLYKFFNDFSVLQPPKKSVNYVWLTDLKFTQPFYTINARISAHAGLFFSSALGSARMGSYSRCTLNWDVRLFIERQIILMDLEKIRVTCDLWARFFGLYNLWQCTWITTFIRDVRLSNKLSDCYKDERLFETFAKSSIYGI